jgi:hypothetical protein
MLDSDRPYKYSDGGCADGGIGHTDSKPGVPIAGRAASFAGSGAEAGSYPVDKVWGLSLKIWPFVFHFIIS